jgi:hypothetical protein
MAVSNKLNLVAESFSLLGICGLDDLARDIAGAIVRTADVQAFYPLDEPLKAATAALNFAWHVDDSEVQRFLRNVLSVPDLKHLMGVNPYRAAEALQSLWNSARSPVIAYFLANLPIERFRWFSAALERRPGQLNQLQVVSALQLIGALRCFQAENRLRLGAIRFRDAEEIMSCVTAFTKGGLQRGNARFGWPIACLWVGVRTLASQISGMRIDADTGEKLLAAWRGMKPRLRNKQALNMWMIEWLTKCQQRNWQIARDTTPPPARRDPPENVDPWTPPAV